MKKMTVVIFLNLLICSVSLYSCGNSNVLSGTYQENDKEKAQDSIASGDYGTAISLLNNYIIANPTDYSAQSMLANAYMLKAGIDILTIIVNISNNVGSAKNNFQIGKPLV